MSGLGILRADELASIRTSVTAIFDTPCTIQRLTGGVYQSIGTNVCLVLPAKRTVTYPGLPSILALQGWLLTLPWNADMRAGDRIATAQATYAIERVEQPSSDNYNFSSVAHCYQLFDASGHIAYLPSNYTISILRRTPGLVAGQTTAPQPVAGLEAVPVYITETAALLQLPNGAVAPGFETHMMWSPAYPIMDGDQVQGYNPSGSANPPLLTVSHVADPGDVPRRVCVLVGLEQAGTSIRAS